MLIISRNLLCAQNCSGRTGIYNGLLSSQLPEFTSYLIGDLTLCLLQMVLGVLITMFLGGTR
jgi:hypothetical protein